MTMEGVWRREEETTAVSCGRVLETLSKVIKNNASRAIEKNHKGILYYSKLCYYVSKDIPL